MFCPGTEASVYPSSKLAAESYVIARHLLPAAQVSLGEEKSEENGTASQKSTSLYVSGKCMRVNVFRRVWPTELLKSSQSLGAQYGFGSFFCLSFEGDITLRILVHDCARRLCVCMRVYIM